MPAGTYVSLVGHSWGGDTAARIATAMGREGWQVDNVITMNPVRWGFVAPDTSLYSDIRTGAANWTSVNATGGGRWDASNLIAGLGRDYGSGPQDFAYQYIDAPLAHQDFWQKLDMQAADGATPRMSIRAP